MFIVNESEDYNLFFKGGLALTLARHNGDNDIMANWI